MEPCVRQKIYDYLNGRGLRRTVQRDAIIEAAFDTREHFTAETLLERARRIEPSVSRATVYRTLPLLVASGLLRAVDFGRDFQYYDPNFIDRPHHNHLICVDCQQIVEFEDAHIDILENCISRRLGFSPAVKRVMRLEARCEELRLHGTCQRKERAQQAAASPGPSAAAVSAGTTADDGEDH